MHTGVDEVNAELATNCRQVISLAMTDQLPRGQVFLQPLTTPGANPIKLWLVL